MSSYSPGCACTASLRGTELDPGLVAMATTGTNHGWGAESRSRELQVTARSGIGVLMADGAKETPAVVRGKTWHRGGSDWEREARANQGSAAGTTQAVAAPAKLGSSRLGVRQQRSRATGAPKVGYSSARRRHRAAAQGTGALRRLRRWCAMNGMKMRGGGGGGGGGGALFINPFGS